MTATPPQDFNEFLVSEGIVPAAEYVQVPGSLDEIDSRHVPMDSMILAVSGTIVICSLAVFLGWQIALVLVAGFVTKSIMERPARDSGF